MKYIHKLDDETYMEVDDHVEFDNVRDMVKYACKLSLATFLYGMIGVLFLLIIACIADLF